MWVGLGVRVNCKKKSMYKEHNYSKQFTKALIDFECFVRNILDSDELTDSEKVEEIIKQL